jgi:2-desacetyl-2-hydroxyethyl bacteriochlorophyllide A dehydrogenase
MQRSTAVVFASPGQVELEPRDLPDPQTGQVLVKTDRTLISTGTELTALRGEFPAGSAWSRWVRYPFTAGYCNVGTVLAAGDGIDGIHPGDRVASTGPHATHIVASASSLWPIPESVDSDAASFSVLTQIAMGGVRRSRLMFGESVVIVGAGLLGQLAARFCSAAGAWPVIVVDTAAGRLDRLPEKSPAIQAVNAPVEQAAARVQEMTRGRLADIVFEVTGSPAAVPGAVKLARKMGRVILLGSSRGPTTIDLHDEVHTLSLEVIGAHNSSHPPAETPNTPWSLARDVELFYQWQAAGIVDVRPLITHRYPGLQAPEAFRMLLEDRTQALGVVLDWSGEGRA